MYVCTCMYLHGNWKELGEWWRYLYGGDRRVRERKWYLSDLWRSLFPSTQSVSSTVTSHFPRPPATSPSSGRAVGCGGLVAVCMCIHVCVLHYIHVISDRSMHGMLWGCAPPQSSSFFCGYLGWAMLSINLYLSYQIQSRKPIKV